MTRVLPSLALAAGIAGGTPAALSAQWGVSLEVQRTAFGGTSRDTATDGTHGSFRPAGALAVTARADRRIGRLSVGVGIRYVRAAVLLDGPDVFIGVQDDFAAFEAMPEIRVRIARSSTGASLHGYAGPVIGIWTFSNLGTRAVPGAMGGIAGSFPVMDRLTFWVRVGGGMTRSVFRDQELPPEFRRYPTRRIEFSIGVRYGR
jgi:hypothetical protein